jgi:hypothetical protein
MAVDLKRISINTASQGFHDWLDYADMLQELADEVYAFLNTHRDVLDSSQKAYLRSTSDELRQLARKIATIAAINILQDFQDELKILRAETQKIDNLVIDINNTKVIISGLAKILTVITGILKAIK